MSHPDLSAQNPTPPKDDNQRPIDSVASVLDVNQETLQAIGRGEVDALLIGSPGRKSLFTRQGAEEPYRLLIEEMQEGAATLNAQGLVLYANRALAALAGVSLDQLAGQYFSALLIPEHRQPFAQLIGGMACSPHVQAELIVRRPEGRHVSVRLTGSRLPGNMAATLGLVVVDLSLFKRAEEQLRIAARVFDKTGEAIVVTDAQSIIQTVNEAVKRTLGYEPEELIGRSIRTLNSAHHGEEFFDAMYSALEEVGFWQGEIWNRHKDGTIESQWKSITAVYDEQGQLEHYVSVMSDLAKNRDFQRRIEYLATHDVLTQLPNRALFLDRLTQSLAQARRSQTRLAVLFINLDNFKKINDTLGHDAGDGLLKAVAVRLRTALRDVDTLSRQGGDEFTVTLSECTPERADQVARRLKDELTDSMVVEGHTIFITGSLGIALFPDDGDDAAALLSHASIAMYRSKEQGPNHIEFYRPELNERLIQRAVMETALHSAIRNRALRLVYQPKIGLGPDRPLVGAEALLRWHDPILGHVPPSEFIPVAEASGLIVEVDRLVQNLLLEQLAQWEQAGLSLPKIAFNVSARSLRDPGFAEQLARQIRALGVSPHTVPVEVTEGSLLDNTQEVLQTLQAIKAADVTIAIDDFGTGYSSMAYLKRMPLRELKVDKSFVDGLGLNPDDEAIAVAVLALAHALGLSSVAEGVETPLQLDWLQRHHCDVVQGYLFSRPLEVDVFEQWLSPAASGHPVRAAG